MCPIAERDQSDHAQPRVPPGFRARSKCVPPARPVMGFSMGGIAALFSSGVRFPQAYGSANTFAAHVVMYASCNSRLEGDANVSPVPIRLFHGITDDYVSIVPC